MKWMEWVIHRCCNIGDTPLSLSKKCMLILPKCQGEPGAAAQGSPVPAALPPAHGQGGFAISQPFVIPAHPDCAQLVPLRAWPKLKLALMLEQREMLWFQALSVHLQNTISISSKKKTNPSANISHWWMKNLPATGSAQFSPPWLGSHSSCFKC